MMVSGRRAESMVKGSTSAPTISNTKAIQGVGLRFLGRRLVAEVDFSRLQTIFGVIKR